MAASDAISSVTSLTRPRASPPPSPRSSIAGWLVVFLGGAWAVFDRTTRERDPRFTCRLRQQGGTMGKMVRSLAVAVASVVLVAA